MKKINYSKVYKKAAANKGWVFEHSKNTEFECEWGDIYEYVLGSIKLEGMKVLDIGTADGLKFFKLSPYIKEGIGIDSEKSMVELAKKHKQEKGIENIEFITMDTGKMDFDNESFDLITSRHAPFSMKEVHRLLKPGGIFITQQVHERDKQNLKDVFNRGQNFDNPTDEYLNKLVKEANEIGFSEIESQKSSIDYFFNSRNHLVDFLTYTPVIPDFNSEEEMPIVDNFIDQNSQDEGIRSNSERFLLKLVK